MKSLMIILAIILITGTGCIPLKIEPQITDEVRAPSGYQEYRNEEFGFSFMYPNDWVLTDSTDTIYARSGWVVGVKTPNTQELIEARKLPPDSEYNLIVSYWDDINNTYAKRRGKSRT